MAAPRLADTILAAVTHKRLLSLSNGRTLPMVCDRPFSEAATDMLRSAIRACKPAPTVLSSHKRTIRSVIPT